jgi:hypothetical protein
LVDDHVSIISALSQHLSTFPLDFDSVLVIYKVQEIQNHSEFSFGLFCTWLNRGGKIDYKK